MEALADEKELIHLYTGKAYVKEDNKRYKTDAIGVYVCQQFAPLSLELLHETALMIAMKSK
eukprot:6565409-Ditylum_brightwellii.AAC.1